jgi:hypothetical protein
MGPRDPAVIGHIAGAGTVVAITAGVASVAIFRPFTEQRDRERWLEGGRGSPVGAPPGRRTSQPKQRCLI